LCNRTVGRISGDPTASTLSGASFTMKHSGVHRWSQGTSDRRLAADYDKLDDRATQRAKGEGPKT